MRRSLMETWQGSSGIPCNWYSGADKTQAESLSCGGVEKDDERLEKIRFDYSGSIDGTILRMLRGRTGGIRVGKPI